MTPESDVVRKAMRLVEAERALRLRAEHELRMARMELTRARRMIVGLQRQARGERHDGTAARSEVAEGHDRT